jgi:hypothetical protein
MNAYAEDRLRLVQSIQREAILAAARERQAAQARPRGSSAWQRLGRLMRLPTARVRSRPEPAGAQ